jgi:serine-type D-Ala-D-Ala carboxypeptidase
MNNTLQNGSFEQACVVPSRVERLSEITKTWVEDGTVPALATMAARKGFVFHQSAHGKLAAQPNSSDLRPDSIFPLSSLTKPITASAILVCVDDGILDLNLPAKHYVPELIDNDRVAIHHLLTFTSGYISDDVYSHVESQGEVQCHEAKYGLPQAKFEYLYARRDSPLTHEPGSEMAYGGHSYELLAAIVYVVSGKTLADFANERIFRSLEMNDTSYVTADTKLSRIVNYGRTRIDSDEQRRVPAASSGVCSTVEDMAKFGQMFLNGGTYGDKQVLSRASVCEMTQNQIPGVSAKYQNEFFPEGTWGFGWNLRGWKKQPKRGSIQSRDTYFAGGAGGVLLWIDPVYEIVGCFFGVERGRDYVDPTIDEYYYYPAALFMNAVTASAS